MLLKDKVVIVTGGARGLGQGMAVGLAQAGARVAVLDFIDTAETMAKLNGIGSGHLARRADVTDFAGVAAAVEEVTAECGEIHGLVNNAGLYAGMGQFKFEDIPSDDWDRMMAINVKGVWNVTRAVAPQMRKQGYGKIVNISSTTMMVGAEGMLHYVASKGAVFAMTRSLSRELGKDGVRVNSVVPGLTLSQASIDNIGQGLGFVEKRVTEATALKRMQQPDDIVGSVLYLLSPLSDAVTGQALTVDGGMVHW